VEFKTRVEEVDTSSAFARSVPMARPNGMVVEVNDVFVPRSQAARDLSTQLCNLTHLSLVSESESVTGMPEVNTTPLVRYIQRRVSQSPGSFPTILGLGLL
jgi:hypothetical protein